MNHSASKGGFTLVELLVVIAMLMLLAGSVTSAVVKAQKRSKITAATTVVQEMTNAILAYENYGELDEMSDQETTRGKIKFLLGETSEDGRKVPVLFNAALKGDRVLDPWGHPYRITIKKGRISGVQTKTMKTCVFFPNYCRRQAGEAD